MKEKLDPWEIISYETKTIEDIPLNIFDHIVNWLRVSFRFARYTRKWVLCTETVWPSTGDFYAQQGGYQMVTSPVHYEYEV